MRRLLDLVRTLLSSPFSATPASRSQSANEFDLAALPAEALGDLYLDLLENPVWVARRVETVRIPDNEGLQERERTVSIDVDVKELKSRLGAQGFMTTSAVVPLGLVPKGLMLDFDIRLDSGNTTSLLTRREDARVAALVVLAAVRRSGNAQRLSSELVDAIESLAIQFPVLSEEATGSEEERSPLSASGGVRPPAGLSTKCRLDWEAIQEDPVVRRLMKQLSEHYLPLARLQLSSSRLVVKYRRLENDVDPTMRFLSRRRGPDKRWAFYQKRPYWPVVIRAGHIGRATSEHLRVVAPEGTNFAFAMLVPAPDGDRPTSLEYTSRISPERAAMYTSGVEAGDYYFVAALIPSLGGFVRPSLWLTGIVAFVLGFGAVSEQLWSFLESVRGYTDAAVTLLLVVPTLFVAYILREGEHHVRRQLLMPARNLSLATLLPLLVAAVSLFVDLEPISREIGVDKLLAPVWGLSSLIALFLFASLAAIGIRVRDAQRFVSEQAHATVEQYVYGAIEDDDRGAFRRLTEGLAERLGRSVPWASLLMGSGFTLLVTSLAASRSVPLFGLDLILLAYFSLLLSMLATQLASSRLSAFLWAWLALVSCFGVWHFVGNLNPGEVSLEAPVDVIRLVMKISALTPELLFAGTVFALLVWFMEYLSHRFKAAGLRLLEVGLTSGPLLGAVWATSNWGNASSLTWLLLAGIASLVLFRLSFVDDQIPRVSRVWWFGGALAVTGVSSVVAVQLLL